MNLRMTLVGIGFLLALSGCPDDETTPDCSGDTVLDPATNTCVAAVPTCAVGQPGSIAMQCAGESRVCLGSSDGAACAGCLAGFRNIEGTCVATMKCADLSCTAAGRSCLDASGSIDAQCGDCLESHSEEEGTCVQFNCELGSAPGSLLESCARDRRLCFDEGEGAVCGDCWAGFLDRNGVCTAIRTCGELGCEGAARICLPETSAADANCGECLGGYEEVGGACLRRAAATCGPSSSTDSISDACAAEGRTCVEHAEGALCDMCLDGLVEHGATKLCVVPTSCSELDCGADNRNCEGGANGRCTTCLSGFTDDAATGACRPVVTCDEITCVTGDECVSAGGRIDAFCRKDCGAVAIWGGNRCEPCPRCDARGEVGRYAFPTLAGNCICETEPGYYYTVGGDVGTFRCDADDDGWVRESARTALESSDPSLLANANCGLRTIDHFLLVNEQGETTTSMLMRPLALYETDRNDDQTILETTWSQRGLPYYGGEWRTTANEINRLTKFCHHKLADYNDNGIADVEEWADVESASDFRPDQRPFNQFSYFAELHAGRYEDVPNAPHGRYVIAEKSRLSEVAVTHTSTTGDYWRECRLSRDATYDRELPVGMDFARLDPTAGFSGMNFHSQYKCLVFEAEPNPHNLNELTASEAAASQYRLNLCGATAAPIAGDGNPGATQIGCDEIAPEDVTPGDVAWGSVPYSDHAPHLGGAAYVRGCTNACIERLATCPGYSINPVAVSCQHDPFNFGSFVSCTVVEVCDGLDNDGIGGIDDGNPEGDLPCATGALGICAAGTTDCRGGVLECDQNEPARSETCDGTDENCDGAVDEGQPGSGADCTIDGLQGACAVGTTTCAAGGQLLCVQTTQPAPQEVCNNGIDDDCNGESNEGEGGPECTDYYLDQDRDGWGVQGVPVCLCQPDPVSGFVAVAREFNELPDWDCCDLDDDIYPRADAAFYAVRNACQRFDYDCNEDDEYEFKKTAVAGCGMRSFSCGPSNEGWAANTLPACGTISATHYINDCSDWFNLFGPGCQQESEDIPVRCR